MPRLTALLALVSAGLVAVLIALVLKVRSLNRELARQTEEARVASETKEMPGLVPKQVLDEERVRTAELNRKVLELDAALAKARADAKKETAKKEPEPGETPPDGDKDGKEPNPDEMKVRDLMKKLGKVCKLGEDLPEAAAKELGLDPLQVSAVNIAIKEEEKRLTEALQRFYAENFTSDASLEGKNGNEVMTKMLPKIMGEVYELAGEDQEKMFGIHTGETSLEELLGPDKLTTKLARELHSIRLQTFEKLSSSLAPDQLAKFREEYWREGSFYWPKGQHFEFGMAPKDMKK